ncbi:leiomodin-2 [Impatiens glandulifera]|uniref:leiomodin-2 n=1 Tax=Impatiens glandulifera TaxID=253017 RepID=UPI001FB08744|nr:leiomodin-2 [Impatiens glandulifera]
MQRKRLPIFQKVFNLKKVSILIAKVRKPIIRKLVILKKWRKLELVRHYSSYGYGYIQDQEYQYSPPSSTRSPLIQYGRRPTFKNRKLFNKLHHSLLYFLNCVCMLEDEKKIQSSELMRIESFGNSMEETKMVEFTESDGGEDEEEEEEEEEDDWLSVDERAEKFIQSFYDEMRRQRKEAFLQITE